MISHTAAVMLGPILVGGYLIFLIWREKFRRGFLLPAAAATALGFGLAAFFLAPFLADRGAIDMTFYTEGYYNYRDHFIAPKQLLHSPWGYGTSVPGADDGMSFRLGLLQIAGALAAAIFAAGFTLVALFMCLEISAPVWAAVPPLRFLGLPLRLLLGPALGMAILCGAAAGSSELFRRFPWAGAGLACAVFVLSSIPMIGFQDRAPLRDFRYRLNPDGTPAQGGAQPGTDRLVFTREFVRDQFLFWSDRMPKGWWPYPTVGDLERPRAEIARGRAVIEMLEEGPATYRMLVRAETPSLLRLNVYKFPGWRMRLNGRVVEWGPQPGRRPVQTVEIPAGVHELQAAIERTPSRWFGDLASLASLILVGAFVILPGLRNRPVSHAPA
jgi:hypothetical protein